MVYTDDGCILVRNMKEADPKIIYNEEISQGHHRTIESFSNRLKDQQEGKAIPLVAEYKGNIAGYANVYLKSNPDGTLRCEIEDFGVFIKYRNQGIGSKLMDIAEQIASDYSNVVHLGVGLHSGYGSAQRMYIKRGYIPDGSGVWYKGSQLEQYAECKNDDDLILWLSKKLCQK